MTQFHEGLNTGGPEVSYEHLYLLERGELTQEEADIIKTNICTWKNWHNAYQEVQEGRTADLSELKADIAVPNEIIDLVKRKVSAGFEQESESSHSPQYNSSQWKEEIRQYLELSESELREELWEEAATGEVELVRSAGHPFDPYIRELRRVVCEEWDWTQRRNDPEWNDPLNLSIALADAMFVASVSVPFPITLAAVTIVKLGIDRFCKRKNEK